MFRFVTVDGKVLEEKEERCFRSFVGITKLIAEHYQVADPIKEIVGADCIVDGDSFCYLVEKVFLLPSKLLYGWCPMAAGMYEVLRGERVDWRWPPEETPLIPLNPVKPYGHRDLEDRGRVIGSEV